MRVSPPRDRRAPARAASDTAGGFIRDPGFAARFALRFALCSIPLFVVWAFWVCEPYLAGLARVFAATARWTGFDLRLLSSSATELHFALGDVAWSNRFGMTAVNAVPLAALLFATGGVSWWRRVRLVVNGLALLCLTHWLGLWTDVLHVHLHPRAAMLADGVRALVTGLGTFLFPLLIWGFLQRERLASRRSG